MGAFPLGDGLPAARANLTLNQGIGLDLEGRLVIAESNRMRRVGSDGRTSTLAGTGVWGIPPSGPPRGLQPDEHIGVGNIAVGPAGEVYSTINYINSCVTGISGGMIWRIDPADGKVSFPLRSEVCGARNIGDDGPSTAAFARSVNRLAVDSEGRIYFSESASNRVRRIDPDGIIRAMAGSGTVGFAGDGGPAVRAAMRNPLGIAPAASGEVYIADTGNNRIRKVTPDGNISTFAEMNNVLWLRVLKSGELLATDGFAMRRFAPDGASSTLIYNASTKGRRFIQDFLEDRDGTLLVADDFQVWRLNADGSDVGIFAGADGDAGKAGPPEFARVINPLRTRVTADGTLWFLDHLGLRRRTTSGTVEAVSTGATSFDVNAEGIVYLLLSNRLDRLADGRRTTFVAGNNFNSNDLQDVVVNSKGDIFIADQQNHRVLKVTPAGDVGVLAGTGTAGNTGDGGPADKAQISAPEVLALGGPAEELFIAVQGGVRKVSASGIITSLTGTGGSNNCNILSADVVAADKAGNCQFTGMAVDAKGDVYLQIADRLFRLRGGTVARIAGGNRGFSGDGGAATKALVFGPRGLTATANGDLVFADSANHRIRRIQGFSPFDFSPESVAFAGSLNGPSLEERVTVTSADGDPHRFRIRIVYPAGRTNWLTVTPLEGEVTQAAPVSLRLTASVQGLSKGVYSARVIMTDTQSQEYTELPVTLLVSGTQQQLRLTRTGFTFIAAQGGPAPPPQSMNVQNSGRGALPFTVATSRLSGGDWLNATPTSGTADTVAQPAVAVSVNPAGLGPGVYFGLVTVNSTAADNAPQSAVVLLQVLATGQSPGPIIEPAGLIFTSTAAQTITLGNARSTPMSYTISPPAFPDRRTWFQLPASAATGSILPGQTTQIQIRPQIDGIPPGQYRAQLSIRFAPDTTAYVVELLLVIANSSGASAKINAAGNCKPTKLLPIFQQPGGGFAATAGWPQLVQLRVVDDCQDPQVKGRVRVSFNNGDPPLLLTPQADGVWTGTWAPGRVATRIELSARAESFDPDLAGAQAVTGGLRDDVNRPRIAPGAVFSEASLKRNEPVAVGGNIMVQGTRMASGIAAANTIPLPTRLGETSVLVGGKSLRLVRAAEGEVKGLIPFTVADATIQQLIVQRGNSYSLPEPVLIAPVQPALYSVDGTGRGQGEVYVKEEDQLVLADAARPAVGGEEVTIIATGLGAVDPKVEDGAPGAADPVSNVLASIRVQIQGKEAPVKSATLLPDKPGRYRVVVAVPQDVTPDPSARISLTLADQAVSNAVTMNVTVK